MRGAPADALDEEDGEDPLDDEDDDASDYEPSPRGALAILARFLAPSLARERRALALLVAGVGAETLFNAAFPLALKYLIDDALTDRNAAALTRILLLLGGLGVLISGVSVAYEVLNARLAARLVAALRTRLFDHLQTLSAEFHARRGSAEVLTRFAGDMAQVEELVVTSATQGLLPALEVVSGSLLLFVLNGRLAAAALLLWPLTVVGTRVLSRRAVAASYDRRRADAAALSIVKETLTAHQVVRTFGLQGIASGWFAQRNRVVAHAIRRTTLLNAMLERLLGTGVLLLHLGILAAGAWLVFHGRLSIGALIAFEGVFWELSYSLGYVTQFVPTLVHGAAAAQHIDELLAVPPTVVDRPNAVPLPRLAREIVVDDVSFHYPDAERGVERVRARIAAGSRVALVGPSGAGKTTLLGLLLRQYDPTSGRVLFDGYDLRDVTRASLLAQTAVVFQDSVLFTTSLRENIRLGHPTATDAAVEAAARAAEIHDFIAALPAGYDTITGEGGNALSGGQRQRVALARALLRDPALLVLDEATSSLDQATADAIGRTLRRVGAGRTVLTVTHRLAAVTDADLILVLDAGRVVEAGHHDQLLARRGTYARLWAGQQPDATGRRASDRA